MITYLLHAEYPTGIVMHYCGSTREDQFARRMRSHASGYGTKTTAQIYEKDGRLRLVRTWKGTDRTQERLMLREPELAPFCPLCSPKLPLLPDDVHVSPPIDGAPPKRDDTLSF